MFRADFISFPCFQKSIMITKLGYTFVDLLNVINKKKKRKFISAVRVIGTCTIVHILHVTYISSMTIIKAR